MGEALARILLGGVALALLGALVALGVRKGGDTHRAAGRVFRGLVLAVTAVLIPATVLSGDAFLALVAVIAAYLVQSGVREARRGQAGDPVGPSDTRPLLGLLAAAAGFVGWGLVVSAADGPIGFLPICVAFAGLLLLLAFFERRRLAAPSTPHGWVAAHVGGMGLGAVAVASALGAVTHDAWGLPSWVPWLAPVLVGAPVVLRWQARARADGRDATFF